MAYLVAFDCLHRKAGGFDGLRRDDDDADVARIMLQFAGYLRGRAQQLHGLLAYKNEFYFAFVRDDHLPAEEEQFER